MMLGEVVAENPGPIGGLDKLQTFFVELLQRNLAALQMVENSECDFHEAPSSGGYSEQRFRVRR